MNPNVDIYFEKAEKWKKEVELLRSLLLDCLLHEELKWGCPCYVFQNKNVVLIHTFKEYCALLFFKGALLSDSEQILIQQTEHTQAARQLRFTSVNEISKAKAIIKAYIFEAIEIEKAGLNVVLKKSTEINFPEELLVKFESMPTLKEAFEALTPGRQRAYTIHFTEAKQAKTRASRIENMIPRILKGKGLNDCVCGLSKRMPSCDGSHSKLKK